MGYDEFVEDISGAAQGMDLWDTEDDSNHEDNHYTAELPGKSLAHKGRPSKMVQDGLRYTEEDIQATAEYVLVVPQAKGGMLSPAHYQMYDKLRCEGVCRTPHIQ